MLILINAGLVAAIVQMSVRYQGFEREAINYIDFVGLIISITAILSSGFIFFAIDASSDQFEYLRKQYLSNQDAYERLGFPRPFGDENEERSTKMFPRPLYSIMGKPYIIPAALFFLWFFILIALGWWFVSVVVSVGMIISYLLNSKTKEKSR